MKRRKVSLKCNDGLPLEVMAFDLENGLCVHRGVDWAGEEFPQGRWVITSILTGMNLPWSIPSKTKAIKLAEEIGGYADWTDRATLTKPDEVLKHKVAQLFRERGLD